MKILVIDIETAPATAHVWSLFKQTIGINQITETGRVLCFAAQWVKPKLSKVEFWSEFEHGTEVMLQRAHALLDEADAVVSYNGQRFDMPTLNREFLKFSMAPPAPYQHIDLLRVARKQFRFASNKMDHLLKELGLGSKVRHPGHELWVRCMQGEPKAWRLMERYNRGDIRGTVRLYKKMLPWIDNHPNHALFIKDPERPTCTNCGSTKIHARGEQHTKVAIYHRYQCTQCNTWLRGRYRLNPKNPNVLVQAK